MRARRSRAPLPRPRRGSALSPPPPSFFGWSRQRLKSSSAPRLGPAWARRAAPRPCLDRFAAHRPVSSSRPGWSQGATQRPRVADKPSISPRTVPQHLTHLGEDGPCRSRCELLGKCSLPLQAGPTRQRATPDRRRASQRRSLRSHAAPKRSPPAATASAGADASALPRPTSGWDESEETTFLLGSRLLPPGIAEPSSWSVETTGDRPMRQRSRLACRARLLRESSSSGHATVSAASPGRPGRPLHPPVAVLHCGLGTRQRPLGEDAVCDLRWT